MLGLASMLTRLINHNDQIPLSSTSLTRFHSRSPPSISIRDYLKRIYRYTNSERICLILILNYIDRICKNLINFTICSLTVHRFCITSVTLGSKFICDSFYSNARYAKVGGISLPEINLLEREFLLAIDYRLLTTNEELNKYYKSLVESHPQYTIQRTKEKEENEMKKEGKEQSLSSRGTDNQNQNQKESGMKPDGRDQEGREIIQRRGLLGDDAHNQSSNNLLKPASSSSSSSCSCSCSSSYSGTSSSENGTFKRESKRIKSKVQDQSPIHQHHPKQPERDHDENKIQESQNVETLSNQGELIRNREQVDPFAAKDIDQNFKPAPHQDHHHQQQQQQQLEKKSSSSFSPKSNSNLNPAKFLIDSKNSDSSNTSTDQTQKTTTSTNISPDCCIGD